MLEAVVRPVAAVVAAVAVAGRRYKVKETVLLVVTCVVLAACGRATDETTADDSSVGKADRVLKSGAVYTVDADRNWAEAVAIIDGQIAYVGDDAGVAAWVGPQTEVIDLAGQMLLPGFHDSHIHIMIGTLAEDECDLLRLESEALVAARLDECTAVTGLGKDGWLIGGGWSEWLWPEANPRKGLLDALFPDRPVYLESSFGHSAWVNSKALEIAGIDENSVDPKDGRIERDPESGEASGTLRDAAMLLVKEKLPPMTVEDVNFEELDLEKFHTSQ